MTDPKLPEVWLRGPVENVPGELQPVAHALLQSMEEINEIMKNLDSKVIWQKPLGLASIAFHIQHIVGILDRLFAYSEGRQLSQQQFDYLSSEGQFNENLTREKLSEQFTGAIISFIARLSKVEVASLYQKRAVGRSQLPSTTIGLLFHCAEHTMRHTGQMLVTAKLLQASMHP